jgi:hypothetical protein
MFHEFELLRKVFTTALANEQACESGWHHKAQKKLMHCTEKINLPKQRNTSFFHICQKFLSSVLLTKNHVAASMCNPVGIHFTKYLCEEMPYSLAKAYLLIYVTN